MLLGCSNDPNNESGILSVQNMVGEQLGLHRQFTTGGLPSTFANSPCNYDDNRGWYSAYSCKPSVTELAAGSWNVRIKDWVKSVPSGHTVDLAFWHEFDAKVRNNTFTATQIGNAYTTIRQAFDEMEAAGVQQVTTGNVRLTSCATAYLWNKAGTEENNYTAVWAASHVITADAYGMGTRDPVAIQRDYSEWMDANYPNKGKGIWEFSTRDTDQGSVAAGEDYKEQFIRDFCDYAFNNGYGQISAFNSSIGGVSTQPTFNKQRYADAYAAKIRAYQTGTVAKPNPPIILVPAQGAVLASGSVVTISGTSPANADIKVKNASNVVVATGLSSSVGAWSTSRTGQADNNYTIRATATVNNVESLASSDRNYSVGVVTTPPAPTITTPVEGAQLPTATDVSVTGTAQASSTVTLYNGLDAVIATTTATSGGAWTVTRSGQGDNNYTVYATATVAGIESLPSAERHYSVGTVAPPPASSSLQSLDGRVYWITWSTSTTSTTTTTTSPPVVVGTTSAGFGEGGFGTGPYGS